MSEQTAEIFHVGIVVPSLAESMRQVSAALGVRWATIQQRTGHSLTPTGRAAVSTELVWSLEGPPYIELWQQQEGTLWDEVGLHHLGVYCDGLNATGRRLLGDGWSWVGGNYFANGTGIKVELADHQSMAPRLARYLAGGDLLSGGAGAEYFLPDPGS